MNTSDLLYTIKMATQRFGGPFSIVYFCDGSRKKEIVKMENRLLLLSQSYGVTYVIVFFFLLSPGSTTTSLLFFFFFRLPLSQQFGLRKESDCIAQNSTTK